MQIGLAAKNQNPYLASASTFLWDNLMGIMMITQARLKEVLNYNPDTGLFTWRKRDCNKFNAKFAGKVAGTNKSCEYTRILIDGNIYKAHRLVWLYVHGEWPRKEIDHINHDPIDNRLANLRDVSHLVNGRNSSLKKNSKTGVSGVNWHSAKKRWQSRINANGKRVHLGDYLDFFDAVCARKSAELLYNYHPNHGA